MQVSERDLRALRARDLGTGCFFLVAGVALVWFWYDFGDTTVGWGGVALLSVAAGNLFSAARYWKQLRSK